MSEVLALKYRPKNFDSLIGQNSITTTISLALNNNRLSHAYLFSGLRGSGKTSTARIFSKALVCEHGPTSSPCEVCENCQMANENRHIDIIEMDAASSRKIDDIRDVIEQTKYKPNVARFKIFIIDEVHMLTREAFNALLKTLEEPPSYIKFILATTDPLKLPATILSRTQHFRFKQIAQSDIIHHLSHILNQENISYEIEALEMISRAGHGSLRDSLTLLDQAIIYSKSNITPSEVASMLGLLDSQKLDEIFNAIFSEDRQKILSIVNELESYECEVVLDELIAYVKSKFYAQDASFSLLLCERFFRILSEAKQLLFINADSGFVLSLAFFKMLEAMNIKKVNELINSLEKEKFINPNEQIAQQNLPQQSKPQVQMTQVVNVQPKQTNEPIQSSLSMPQTVTKPQKPITQNIQAQTHNEPIQAQQQQNLQASSYNESQQPINEPKPQNPYSKKFETLIKELYERNYDLGKCFEENINFLNFINDDLQLEICANEEEKKVLRHGWGVIKQFSKEIFGINTKISVKPGVKKKSIEPIKEENSETEALQELPDLNPTLTKEQQQVQDILKNPLIEEAKKLFEPKSIKILTKD